ncbi:DUF547 domain-containing protein, partial [Pseudoalteromonas sp. SG43-5]|nr:DUF547 domain-containing protein [Pseudoalteromonas sp. SG43-5]
SPKSKLTINFEPVNILLESNVLDMGPSRRINAKLDKPPIGTKLRNVFPSATHNESNRFTYELIKSPKQKSLVNDVKKYLESLPKKNNLNLYSKQEQLAYWLNLYNITLINEIVKRYPIVSLEKILTGPDSLEITVTPIFNFALFKIKDYVLFSIKNKQGVLWLSQESVK